MLILQICVAFWLAGTCSGYKVYQDRVPNGNNIPHPCKPNHMWGGLGHLVPGGGGERNPFGEDFDKNGKNWDKCLCEYDSDGDGKTNGEELGDPDCVWEPGEPPSKTTGLSHPGVCEPLDSEACQAKNADFEEICKFAEVNPCIEELNRSDDVHEWTIRFTNTSVPVQETTYVCQNFRFDDVTDDYHIIGFRPIIDNRHVMHHMVIYACDDSAEATTGPDECGKQPYSTCYAYLYLWNLGGNGHCLHEEVGFPLGLHGHKTILIQAHWTNIYGRTDFYDSSGFALLYTKNLRSHEGGRMLTGQRYLAIPPNRKDVVAEGVCNARCTMGFPWDINIVDANVHMHYLGEAGYINLKRDNQTITELVSQDVFSYDSPVNVQFHTPILLKRGEEITTTCHYKSTSRNTETYYGEGAYEEMCFGSLTYYPRIPNLWRCTQYISEDLCDTHEDWPFQEEGLIYFGCNTTAFEARFDEVMAAIKQKCDGTGLICPEECEELLDDLAGSDPCYRGDHLKHLRLTLTMSEEEESKANERYFRGCDVKVEDEERHEPEEKEDAGLCPSDRTGTDDASVQVVRLPLLILSIVVLVLP